mmetsp:Transcript_23894/g.43034  ORF Transcript_23894/g.43034 Transcript_23894/m.43034 type:complete len:96 (+) Transcript_23894:592-879(+)
MMHAMFYEVPVFNSDVSNWDTSSVFDMAGVFDAASTFDDDLSLWNKHKVKMMHCTFYEGTVFNGDVYKLRHCFNCRPVIQSFSRHSVLPRPLYVG